LGKTQVTLVAKILSVSDTATQVTYKVDDGTGALGGRFFCVRALVGGRSPRHLSSVR
jgi:hypothetical protein